MTWTEQDYQRELIRLEALEAFHRARRERQQKDPLMIQYDLQQRLRGRPGLWPAKDPSTATWTQSPQTASIGAELADHGNGSDVSPPL